MSAASLQATKNTELAGQAVKKTRGLCMSVDDAAGTAVINIGGGNVPMPMLSRPSVGWDVWVLYTGAEMICLGPVFRSPGAVVQTVPAAGLVQVLGNDGRVYVLPYAASLTLGVGDPVVIDWASDLVFAKPAAEPVAVVPVPTASGGVTQRESVFTATDSGTFSSSWFGSSVYCGDTTLGAFFYEGIADTIPDAAEIVSVRLYLHATKTSGGAPSIGVHSLTGKSGAPNTDSSVTIAGGSGWKDLPTSHGDLLKTGARRGVGTNHGGYHIFAGAGQNNSGTLVITWRG